MKRWLTPLLLGIAVLISAGVVVETKHRNRALVADLEELRLQRARLGIEWSQLQLEEATLAHPGKVERVAREQLGMTEPDDTVQVSEPSL